ncbi:MAG: hypothetical protein OEZ59_06650, partial [Deltaproteobacteria bacterium]|nr:hypothetical protein [Deltaproteobacteria bacterium]
MDWLSFKTRREPGFRLNIPDLIYLGLTLWLSGWLFHRFPNTSLYGLPLYIVFTFFLFCNVFRIG